MSLIFGLLNRAGSVDVATGALNQLWESSFDAGKVNSGAYYFPLRRIISGIPRRTRRKWRSCGNGRERNSRSMDFNRNPIYLFTQITNLFDGSTPSTMFFCCSTLMA
jgi:hypothetical protein